MVLPETVRPRDAPDGDHQPRSRARAAPDGEERDGARPGRSRPDAGGRQPGDPGPGRSGAVAGERGVTSGDDREAARDAGSRVTARHATTARRPPARSEAAPGLPPDPASRRAPPRTPSSAVRLLALLVLALVAAFFAWVSAEPFWLAVGHGDQGTATVARCTGDGVTQPLRGDVHGGDGAFTAAVALLGVERGPAARRVTVPGPDGRTGEPAGVRGRAGSLLHLRWVGFALVLRCAGSASPGRPARGGWRPPRARRRAVLLSLAGPLALLAGFLRSEVTA